MSNKKPVLTFGSDPEFMLYDRDGRLRSAIGIVKGTKENKVDLGNGCLAFPDNVLVEVNIPCGRDQEEVISNFGTCFQKLSNLVRPYRLNPQASAKYPDSEVKHPDAKVFGCDPEYCAYDLCQVQAPEATDSFRSGGGHIHLGYTSEAYPLMAPTDGDERTDRDWGRVWVVRMLDLFLGIPSLFLDHDPTSAARRRLYGHAGTHRPKEEYGVEYRAVSNFWMHNPRILSLVYRLCEWTVNFVAERGHENMWKGIETCTAYSTGDLRRAINETDKNLAGKFLETTVKKYLPASLMQEIMKFSEPYTSNFYAEWRLK